MADVRPEENGDIAAVRGVNLQAFEASAEADLVDALRAAGGASLSLVAIEDGVVAGHILFSPVEIEGTEGVFLALAPVAVATARQGRGIGSELIRAGLDRCREIGARAVVLLGDPAYYSRFGFRVASEWGLASKWDDQAPPGAFQAIELADGSLGGPAGRTVRFHKAFDEV